MPSKNVTRFQKILITLTAGIAFVPVSAWSLELVQAPPMPTSKSAFVAPNVIISVDDSGSMNYGVKTETSERDESGPGYTEPKNDGTWEPKARRINVLKYALRSVFEDEELIPHNKIRIAWQAMHNNGGYPDSKSVNNSGMKANSMRPIDAEVQITTGSGRNQKTEIKTHRQSFLDFIEGLSAKNGTPSHQMFEQADGYMRRDLSPNGPWSSSPGGTGSKSKEYLGCRRSYHIMMTDGRWNGTVSGGDQDGKNWPELGSRKEYDTESDQTRLYRDTYENTLSDWAFKSWMEPLQPPQSLKDADKLKPSLEYEQAPAHEIFSRAKLVDIIEQRPKIICTAWNRRGECTKEEQETICVESNRRGQCTRTEPVMVDVVIGQEEQTKTVTLEKYWNPKYNPATWPHMVTYTIGFSDEAVTWPWADIVAPTEKVPFGYDNSFVDLVTGFQEWPSLARVEGSGSQTSDRALDLWHAAINGRGRFYAVTEAEDLAKAFREIIGKINEESEQLPDKIEPGGTTSGYSLSQNNTGIFGTAFEANKGWIGYVAATDARGPEEYDCPTEEDEEAKCLRFESTIDDWNEMTTGDRLDALTQEQLDNRVILTWGNKPVSSDGRQYAQGVPFKWADNESHLNADQKASLGAENDAEDVPIKGMGMNVLNFIRGDHALEGNTEDKPFRERQSRQGDIVNSQIWYTGTPTSSYALSGYAEFIKARSDRLPMLYVGGNDGMLHGFSAQDGTEKLAYVPRGVIAKLKELTDPDYEHRYYVDGSPMTGDIKDGDDWKTVLVGTLGAGGKGYFVLDVTNPENFSEANAANLVLLDRTLANGATAAEDAADIGNITAEPNRNPANLQETAQITRMNNGRWAAVMGNGYNSTNRRPVLLVQYLDGDRDSDGNLELKRIQTTTDATNTGNAFDNGLSTPTLVDLNGDGMMDIAYAGDNLGNLWKFDLTSDNDNDWTVAFGYNKPLFTARGPAALGGSRTEIQPITAPPIVRYNSRLVAVGTGANARTMTLGGLMVAFGTGRNLTSEDRRTDINQNIQTLYSVLDNTRYRKRSGSDRIEIYENGQGNCESGPATCVPKPEPVGTISSSGMPLAKRAIAAVEGEFATINATEELDQESWNNYKGWYLDFPSEGERLLKPMQFYDSSNILAVYSESPSGIKSAESDNINESCVPIKVDTSAGSQWRTLINILDGKTPSLQLMFKNDTDLFDGGAIVARMSLGTGTPTLITSEKYMLDYTGRGVSDEEPIKSLRMPEQSMRPSWRQLN